MAGHRCIKHQSIEKVVIEYLAVSNRHFHELGFATLQIR